MKAKYTKSFIIILAAIVALGFALIAGRLIHDRQQKRKDVERVQKLPGQDAAEAMQNLVSSIQKEVSGKLDSEKEYKVSTRGWYAEYGPSRDPASVPGYDFQISTAGDPVIIADAAQRATDGGLETGKPTKPITTVVDALGAALQKRGFKSTDTLHYRKDDQTCVINVEATYTLSMICNSPEVHTYFAAQLDPFVKSYAANKKVTTTNIEFGPLKINSQNRGGNPAVGASETAGYDLAELVVQQGGTKTVALYYQKDKAWHFITEAHDEFGFSCEDVMKNPDARKAMRDQVCYEYRGDVGQIRVDSDRRALQ